MLQSWLGNPLPWFCWSGDRRRGLSTYIRVGWELWVLTCLMGISWKMCGDSESGSSPAYQRGMSPSHALPSSPVGVEEQLKRARRTAEHISGGILDLTVTCSAKRSAQEYKRCGKVIASGIWASPGPKGRAKLVPQKSRPGASSDARTWGPWSPPGVSGHQATSKALLLPESLGTCDRGTWEREYMLGKDVMSI